MLKTRKRKIKSIIAEIIANLLIMIAILIKCLIPATILILIIVGLHITYEQFRQAMIVVSILGALIAVIKVFREPRKEQK